MIDGVPDRRFAALVARPESRAANTDHAGTDLPSRMRAAGLRPTVARLGVLQIMEASDGRLSVEEVFGEMMQRGTAASMGTVYRVIHDLERCKLLLREWGPNHKALYRCMPSATEIQSLQLVCHESGHTVTINDADLYARLVAAANREGIDLSSSSVSIHVQRTRTTHTPRQVVRLRSW